MVTQPLLIPVNEKEFLLTQDYTYAWAAGGQHFRIVVFAGQITDIASIPRPLWSLTGFMPDGLHRAAAIVHDLLYQWRGLPQRPCGLRQVLDEVSGTWQDCQDRWTRLQCDQLFTQIMEEAGTIRVKRDLMFAAVRAFGWAAW